MAKEREWWGQGVFRFGKLCCRFEGESTEPMGEGRSCDENHESREKVSGSAEWQKQKRRNGW